MKLEFEDNDYYLVDDNNDTIATTDKIFLKVDGVVNKLSRENCDEVYGDGEVYVDEYAEEWKFDERIGFRDGFNKAMELMVDNKFNDNHIVDAFMAGHLRGMSTDMGEDNPHPICSEYLNSIQQPTEIDVEIVTEPYVKYVSRSLHSVYPPLGIQNKLDKDGCLILKKK